MSRILTPSRAPHQPHRRSVMPTGGEESHMSRRGTLDPRRRYNMSHRWGLFGHWHGRCLYIHRNGKQAGEGRSKGGSAKLLNKTGHRGSHGCLQTRQERQQLLLHSKQASDQITPLTRGFFSPAVWQSRVGVTTQYVARRNSDRVSVRTTACAGYRREHRQTYRVIEDQVQT